GSAHFTWIYSMDSAGSLNFNARAGGEDANSGTIAYSTYSNRGATIQTQASLQSSISAIPEYAGVGWTITIVMSVTNAGQADAISVAPSLLISPESSGTATQISVPSSPVTITGGSSHSFTWTYSAASTGSVIFSGNAMGSDANNNNALLSAVTTDTTYIQTPAALSSSIVVTPVTISSGQIFTIRMFVTNTGMASAVSVTPSSLIKFGGAGHAYYSGPVPVSANIPGGGTSVFTWTYSATGPGTLWYSGNASGTDSLNNTVISSIPSASAPRTVISGANLTASIYVSPARINMDNMLTVIMVVTNTGGATANNVQADPSNLTQIGTGGCLPITSPSPASVNITGGNNHIFTWTFSAVGTGTVNFSGRA
ncbi:MAG TPA: hypothetical protein PLF61_07405, partial [Candidatus Goldiibacteriota bacterium]|nr:hypothetical protein [Candidatus Goldiibacteriota bacterium]